jgi:hypothetical protein
MNLHFETQKMDSLDWTIAVFVRSLRLPCYGLPSFSSSASSPKGSSMKSPHVSQYPLLPNVASKSPSSSSPLLDERIAATRFFGIASERAEAHVTFLENARGSGFLGGFRTYVGEEDTRVFLYLQLYLSVLLLGIGYLADLTLMGSSAKALGGGGMSFGI